MEIICVDNELINTIGKTKDDNDGLTLYKKYICMEIVCLCSDKYTKIINDYGHTRLYFLSRFVTTKQLRKLKLKQINESTL